MRVEEAIGIERDPDDVWEMVSDPANDPRWCRKVQSVEPSGTGRWLVRHRPVPLRPALELVVERLDAERPRSVSLREEDEVSVFHVEYRLEPSDAGTVFTQVSDFEWKKLPRFLHGVFAHGVRRDVRGQLRALKKLLES